MVIQIVLAGILSGGGALVFTALLFDPGWIALAAIYSLFGCFGAALAVFAVMSRQVARPDSVGSVQGNLGVHAG
ncbi:MAG: hypothetical protein ACT4OK_13140 [Gemmobacter sp.]